MVEESERIQPSLRSCSSCIHNKTCKILDLQIAHVQTMEQIAKSSGIQIDLIQAEEIGSRCSEYLSPLSLKEQEAFLQKHT